MLPCCASSVEEGRHVSVNCAVADGVLARLSIRSRALVLLVVVLAASCSAAAKSPTRAALVGANTPPRSCVSGWSIAVKPYTAGVLADDLVAESAASYDDVWAVGIATWTVRTGALIEHWDGRRWRVVPGADLGGRRATLAAVAAVTSDNVWAVGTSIGTTTAGLRQQGPLIEHWNGRHWSLVPALPFPLAAVKEPEGLDGIAAAGPDDIWMYGPASSTESPPRSAVISTSTGTAAAGRCSRDLSRSAPPSVWRLPRRFQPTRAGYVWAAGGNIRGFGEAGKPAGFLVERWNGSRWVETTPPAGRYAVGALAVVAPNDVWAVTGSALATGWRLRLQRLPTIRPRNGTGPPPPTPMAWFGWSPKDRTTCGP